MTLGNISWSRPLVAVLLTLGLITSCSQDAERKFVFLNTVAYENLDPHQNFDVATVAIRINLYDGLYRWLDDAPPHLEPWLAQGHEVSPDGLVWTFTLRKGAKFHDGAEITAADVVYSFDRILGLQKGAAGIIGSLVDPGNVKALDRYRVEFTLKQASAIFLSVLPEIHVVNSELVKQHEKGGDWGSVWLSENEAGSGSYQLDEFDPAIGFSANRFVDHFYGWEGVPIDKAEFRVIEELNTRVLGLLKGQYHFGGGYFPDYQLKRLQESGTVKVLDKEYMRLFLFQIHNQRAPLDNVHVRRALNYAFDYDSYLTTVMKGGADRNVVPIPNNMWGVPDDVEGYTFDLDKAKAEIAMSGVSFDRPLEIGLISGFSVLEQAAVVLQNGLRKIGIESTINSYTWPVLLEKVRKKETTPDLITMWISAYYADPHNWIGQMYDPKQSGTYRSASWYENPEVEALIDSGLATLDKEARIPIYEDIARIVTDDAASLMVSNARWRGVLSNDVTGLRFCPIGVGQEVRWLSWK